MAVAAVSGHGHWCLQSTRTVYDNCLVTDSIAVKEAIVKKNSNRLIIAQIKGPLLEFGSPTTPQSLNANFVLFFFFSMDCLFVC